MAKKEQKKEAVKDTVKNEPKGKETKGDVTKVKAKMTKKPKQYYYKKIHILILKFDFHIFF